MQKSASPGKWTGKKAQKPFRIINVDLPRAQRKREPGTRNQWRHVSVGKKTGCGASKARILFHPGGCATATPLRTDLISIRGTCTYAGDTICEGAFVRYVAFYGLAGPRSGRNGRLVECLMRNEKQFFFFFAPSFWTVTYLWSSALQTVNFLCGEWGFCDLKTLKCFINIRPADF